MRKRTLALIVIVGIAAAVLIAITKPWYHRREIRVYFQDAKGLRAGAPVRMAGVDVGSVESVRVRPDLHAAEAVLSLRTPYELRVPKDATVLLPTEGVLGSTFAEVEILNASGPPLENGGVLKSKESANATELIVDRVADIVKTLDHVAKQKPCETQSTGKSGAPGNGGDSKSR